MSGLTELGRILHDEHFRILIWVCGLKNRLTTERNSRPFHPGERRERHALRELIHAVDDVFAHHAFEEEFLFPLIRDRNDVESAACLAEEHAFIEPIAHSLKETATALLNGSTAAATDYHFRHLARELFTAMMGHLVLEEMVVVQRLGALLDPQDDRDLALRHAERRLNFAVAN